MHMYVHLHMAHDVEQILRHVMVRLNSEQCILYLRNVQCTMYIVQCTCRTCIFIALDIVEAPIDNVSLIISLLVLG